MLLMLEATRMTTWKKFVPNREGTGPGGSSETEGQIQM